jgi:MFS family permease
MNPKPTSVARDRFDEHGAHPLVAVSVLVFAQMLPATMVAPAIRPLFALQHGGVEGAMHAFMAVNMLGGAVASPVLGSLADRRRHPYRLAAVLAAIDALLLGAVALPLPVPAILGLRTLEGAAHVGAATILMATAARWARARGHGRAMGAAGTALMLAVALGSAVGGALLRVDPRAPFWAASLLLVGVVVALGALDPPVDLQGIVPARRGAIALMREHPALVLPVTSAFVGRFTIGCLVVTFSLFAHRVHDLSDTAIGGLFTLLTFPFALGVYPASRLGDRVPRAALLALGGIVHAASMLALLAAPSAVLPTLMVCMGLGCAMVFAATLCYAASSVPAQARAGAMSLVNGAGCLGMLAGPAAAGITSSLVSRAAGPADGYRAVFVLAAASMLAWLLAAAPKLVSRLVSELGEEGSPSRSD